MGFESLSAIASSGNITEAWEVVMRCLCIAITVMAVVAFTQRGNASGLGKPIEIDEEAHSLSLLCGLSDPVPPRRAGERLSAFRARLQRAPPPGSGRARNFADSARSSTCAPTRQKL